MNYPPNAQLHPAQSSILRSLRRLPVARFSTLLQPTGLESANFKFHIRALQNLGYIEKLPTGEYRLTLIGKEFSNNLDKSTRSIQKQPKLSIIVVISKTDETGRRQYLCQERHRNPYWGYWSFISGPLRWGVTPEEAAQSEVLKQTGLKISCQVRAFLRKRDYIKTSNVLLEDKLFTIVEASHPQGTLSNSWQGGENAWLTLEELRAKTKRYEENFEVVDMLQCGIPYKIRDAYYHTAEY